MAVLKRLGALSEKVHGVAGRGAALLRPPPIHFGAPRQLSATADVSWWHIPVLIQPGQIHRKALDGCAVDLLSLDGGGSPLAMRWRPNRTANTFPQVTLEEKTVYLVPVAVRKEGEHERAIITNETFLAEGRSKWAMPPGTSTWKLSVRYGEVQTESPHAYLLKVPPVGRSNGHFTLEVRYDADIG